MTDSEPAPTQKSPQPGDVIFIYSGGRDAFGSCILQRVVLNPSTGPWFSHVAIALSSRVAIEASTAADEGQPTWSGATLGKGVRLQLLPDLIIPATTYAVLRNPNATDLSEQFDVRTPHISRILGSGYSTKPLVDEARKGHAALDALIPGEWFQWTAKPDRIAEALRNDPEFRSGIERHLPAGEALASMSDYFCSQLASTLLSRAGVLSESPALETPCTLFDRLAAAGWSDVTSAAYGPEMITEWTRTATEEWQLQFRVDLGFANWFRDNAHSGPAIDLLADTLGSFANRLDETRRGLEARRDQPAT